MLSPRPAVAFPTLGCRLNQVESQEMAALMEGRGFRVAPVGEPAGVFVVNTCTVTGRADFSDRQLIRRIRREHPDALLVVTGCWAQTDPETVAALGGVDLVLGNQEKYRLPELIEQRLAAAALPATPTPSVHVAPIAEARSVPFAPLRARHRALARLRQGAGRVPAPLRLLYRAGGAGGQPQPGSEGGARPGAPPRRCGTRRDHPHRRGSRPLRLGPGPAHQPRRADPSPGGGAGPALAAPLLGAAGVLHAPR
jgi:hypothetical protein